MSSTEAEKTDPLLIILSDAPEMYAYVRSRERDVRRWAVGTPTGEDGEWFGGDPSDPSCYEWTADAPSVTAVINLEPVERARAALDALREVRSDAAVLLLTDEAADLDGPEDGTVARGGRLRDVLRVDMEDELERLEAERRAFCLRKFADGPDVVPILIHPDPDPDAVSSALAVSELLGGSPERTPIVTLQETSRPENRRMLELLHIRVTKVTIDELRRFERVITVDTQPRQLQQEGRPRLAVIDHHPRESGYIAEFCDIRPHYGATATMVTEYLRATDERHVHTGLATALLYGIRTDTNALTRGVTPPDVEAYAFLQERADKGLIQRFERPSYPLRLAQAYGGALAEADCSDGLCVTYVGPLATQEVHVLVDLADFCIGIEHVTWAVVGAELNEELVLAIRHSGKGAGAGELARVLAKQGGQGGGHATMARATMPPAKGAQVLNSHSPISTLRCMIEEALEPLETTRRASHPVPQG